MTTADILASVTPVSKMKGYDAEDDLCLKQMHLEARRYLDSFKWCKSIQNEYFGFWIGGIIALFLFEIENTANPEDSLLWVTVGDLPTAYFVTDTANNPKEALETYIDLMAHWEEAVLSNLPIDECFPVFVPPGYDIMKLAEILKSRLDFLEQNILPEIGRKYFHEWQGKPRKKRHRRQSR